ncbi:MAG: HAD-IA family hydrolase [Candidatus Woesearchaeota archaeon]
MKHKTILVDAVDTYIIEGEGVFEEMHELLETYPNRKIVVTNANDEEIPLYSVDKSRYEFYTLKHKPNKTDPEYFKKLFKHFNLNAEDVIYFEHNIDAVKAAQSIGIKSHYYDPEKKDLKSLKKFLDENA